MTHGQPSELLLQQTPNDTVSHTYTHVQVHTLPLPVDSRCLIHINTHPYPHKHTHTHTHTHCLASCRLSYAVSYTLIHAQLHASTHPHLHKQANTHTHTHTLSHLLLILQVSYHRRRGASNCRCVSPCPSAPEGECGTHIGPGPPDAAPQHSVRCSPSETLGLGRGQRAER